MAEKNNAVCSICGEPYYVCMSCKDTIKLHPFKSFTDTAEHFKVFQVVRGYNTGVYTKDEAKDKFKNVDLHDLEEFRPHIRDIVKDILKEDVVVKASTNEAIVDASVSRKRNYKINKVEVDTIIENENAEIE